MTSISTTPQPTTTPSAPVADAPRAGGGVQGFIGDVIRSAAAGYQTATRVAGVEADKAAIHPFEGVSTITGTLKEKTANVKGLNKLTGPLHTIGGFALLIMTANTSSALRAPGDTAVDLGNRIADAIDGRKTTNGWNLGWGIRSPEGGDGDEGSAGASDAAAGSDELVAVSGLGAALAQSGMQ